MNRGKIIIVLCMVLLSIQIASADVLNLTAPTTETFADNRTAQITANLTNTIGYPVSNTRVNFTADCGVLSAGYNYTNASGIAVVNISSWDLCTANITAEAPNATNATVNVTFVRGPISQIVISADSSGTVNSTHLVTVTVYDKTKDEFVNNEGRWRVMPNVTLNFNAASPLPNQWNSPGDDYNASVSPSLNTTDKNGTTTVTMHLSSRAGTNRLDVNVTNEEGEEVTEYQVIVGLAGEAITLTATASPENVSANGIDLSHVTGKVTDEFENPLLSIGAIRFDVTGSDPIIKPINSVGEATISIGPSKFTGDATVNGMYLKGIDDYTNHTDSVTVVFYAEEPASVVVRADATKISTPNIPGVNISTITATVIDKWGHTLPGRTVNFSLTGPGTLSLPTTTTTNLYGQATITLQSDTAGDATVAAKALNDSGYEIGGGIVIGILDDPFISIMTTIEPDPVEVGGIINVTTSIAGQGNITGTRLAAHAMLTLDRSGSMDPDYYAGTPLDVALVIDRSISMEYLGETPEQPMTDAKTAAKVFIDNLASNAQVGVISFASDSRIDIGLTLLNSSDDKALVRNAIDGISATGSTAIGDGLAGANNMLKVGRTDARRITILLTDGKCTAGGDRDCSNAISVANAEFITIYTIGLGSAEFIDEPLLQRVASETGGRYYNAPSSSELQAVYNSIAQEISDYDITEIEYGTEGFTPYADEVGGSLSPINTPPSYTLKFDAYDLDSGKECYFKVNDNADEEISATGNENWGSFEYNITSRVQNGINVVGFYDPNNWNNAIKNVVILANNITIAKYSSEVDPEKADPYNCTFSTLDYSSEDNFLINEAINDLKVLVDWENTTADLNLRLTSPSGHVYGIGGDTTGYYFDDREAIPIDLRAPEFDTYITSAIPDTVFADATSFYVTDDGAGGEQRCSIMRWKLPDAPTHNAQIESVTMHLRGITPDNNPWNEPRSINIYDLTTSYSDDPTWNCRDSSTSQRWESGGSFSSADNDSYLINSVTLSSAITGDVVEFDITSANWSGNRVPGWGKECSIVLTGSGYDGAGADRFASSETNPTDHNSMLNGYRPLVMITYSIPRDTSEYIWIHPLPYTYLDTDADTVENGNWTVQVTGSGAGSEQFDITTYIDKKSAAKLASHAFISSLDPAREDRVGLATYSYSSTNETASQTSYVREGNQWEGYFTVNTEGVYYFNMTWANASDDLDLYLYDGITLLDSSSALKPESVSATLLPGTDYRVVVNGTDVAGNDSQFTIDVSSSPLRDVMCAYYDNGSARVPRYRQWVGDSWSDEASAKDVGGDIDWIVLQSCPTRNETIMGTLDDLRDLNMQIWGGSGWSAVQEFSRIANYDHRRAFDIAYEQNSGDAVVVYRNSTTSRSVPRYRIWDGSAWGAEGAVNATTLSNVWIQWVRLVAKPNTDEILLVFRRDGDHNNVQTCAQIWNGSAWGNVIILTDTASYGNYQCFDAAYEHDGDAMVAWAQLDGTVRYSRWDGASWSAPATIYTGTYLTHWIKLAVDPNSDNILMGALNADKDVHVTVWNGTTWSSNLKIEENTYEYNKRIMDVSFEQSSGRGLVVWGDSTSTPKYRIWDGSWGQESSASNLGGAGCTRWVQLTPDPDSSEMFLMTSDGNNDSNIQKWDGSSWNIPTEVEASSTLNYECFDITYSKQETAVTQTTVNWLEWRAKIDNPLDDSIVSFNPIITSIDGLTADGMTAIDEGLYEANNALYNHFAAGSKPVENGTIVLLTDGIDNVGYHSMIAEAERAAANNTTIFTVGFGSTIDDGVLRQIANITGGEYYFAPNATVLKNIFVGIAGDLGNFTAPAPKVDIRIGNNAIVEGTLADVTYINDSANVTYFNCILADCSEGYYAHEHVNPSVTYPGNRTTLSWDIGNRPDHIITVGRYWNVTYQLRIANDSAGYVPIVLYPSCITYESAGGAGNCSNNLVPDANVDVVGNETNSSTKPADSIELTNKAVSCGPPFRQSPKPDTVQEYAYRLTAQLKDEDGDPVVFGTVVEFKATSGTLYNYTLHNTSGLLNGTTGLKGDATVWLSSDVPGTITVCAYHTTANGNELTQACTVVIFHSVESPPLIPPAPRPRGVITLESDPFMTDWLSLLWRNR